jgi:hypothetical protein
MMDPCDDLRIGVGLADGGCRRAVRDDAMSRCAIPEPLPFGIRRPPDPKHMMLSKRELLFVGLAISALIYLGSLGPRAEDLWIKAAQAYLMASPRSAQPQRHPLTVAQDNWRDARVPRRGP